MPINYYCYLCTVRRLQHGWLIGTRVSCHSPHTGIFIIFLGTFLYFCSLDVNFLVYFLQHVRFDHTRYSLRYRKFVLSILSIVYDHRRTTDTQKYIYRFESNEISCVGYRDFFFIFFFLRRRRHHRAWSSSTIYSKWMCIERMTIWSKTPCVYWTVRLLPVQDKQACSCGWMWCVDWRSGNTCEWIYAVARSI